MTEYRSRVTVDHDGPKHGDELAAIKAYENLREIADRVDVHVSSSGMGLHLVGWFEAELTFADEVEIRREMGDDPRRVDMDCKRFMAGMRTGVLFTQKDGRQQTKERRYSDVYEALDDIRMRRSNPSERVKLLATEGHKAAPEMARHLHH